MVWPVTLRPERLKLGLRIPGIQDGTLANFLLDSFGQAGRSAARVFEIQLETTWDAGRDSRYFVLELFGQAGLSAGRAFETRLDTTWDTRQDSRQFSVCLLRRTSLN